MKLNIQFPEITGIIKQKTNKEMNLSTISDKTVCASHTAKIKVPLLGEISKEIKVKVTVEQVVGEDLYLSYDGGHGINLLIAGMQALIPQLQDNGMITLTDRKAIIHLGSIEKVHKALQHVEIHNVGFSTDGVVVDFGVKDLAAI